MDITTAKAFKGILGKESPSLFGGYQNRFFRIVEGDTKVEKYLLSYSDKENGTVKGAIPFTEITSITSVNKKEFYFLVGDRKFKLKAENEKLKNDWIDALTKIKEESEKNDGSTGGRSNRGDSSYSKNKNWKIQNQSKDVVEALSSQGVNITQGKIPSEKVIEIKGIKPLLRGINSELLKKRLKHGFMQKKHKSTLMMSQKRWLFLLSSRPLSVEDQLNDEETLDQNSIPSSIKFDTLYYYSLDDDKDTSSYKGDLPLSECSRISIKDVDKEYYIIIDMNDRIFEFSTDQMWERDSWFDAIKNSKITGREIEVSKTKKPRNMTRLLEIQNSEKEMALENKIESEVKEINVGFEEIKDHQILEIYIKKIDTKLLQLVDGCLLCNPVPIDLLKKYCERFNTEILNKVQGYWKYLSENLSVRKSFFILFNRLIKL